MKPPVSELEQDIERPGDRVPGNVHTDVADTHDENGRFLRKWGMVQ